MADLIKLSQFKDNLLYATKAGYRLVSKPFLDTLKNCRNITLHWKDCVTLAGTSFSIVGFAIAFFQGRRFSAYCFGASALIHLFSAHYVHISSSIHDLNNTIESQASENRKLSESNAKLENTIKNLVQKLIEFSTDNLAFGTNIQDNQTQFQALYGQFKNNLQKAEELVGLTCAMFSDKITQLTQNIREEHSIAVSKYAEENKNYSQLLEEEKLLLHSAQVQHKTLLREIEISEKQLRETKIQLEREKATLHTILSNIQEALKTLVSASRNMSNPA